MGNNSPSKQKFIYSIPVTDPKSGETSIYRAPIAQHGLVTRPLSGVRNVQELLIHNFRNCPNRPFLGRRRILDGKLDIDYSWKTYGETEILARQLASGIYKLKLSEEKAQYLDYNLKLIGLYGPNSREWLLTDIACQLYGYTLMPVYDTLGEEACEHMLNETELSTLFLTAGHASGIAKKIKDGTYKFLKNLVILDEGKVTEKIKEELEGVKYYLFSEVMTSGAGTILPYPEIDENQILTFSYTSGTTGTPKGAMISHKNIICALAGAELVIPMIVGCTYLSYLPLAHVMERMILVVVIQKKGRYGFYSGDVKNIRDDLAILKPDIFVSVPRLYNKFYDAIQASLRKAKGVQGLVANLAVRGKNRRYDNKGHYTHGVWDNVVFQKMKDYLGGNVKYMMTGSAPISTEVRKFMKLCFCCPFAEGYGQTEAVAGEFLTHHDDPSMGHVGGPIPHLEFKLIDVPEMNYFSTDKIDGVLQPRGEILVRSGSIIPGYYKNPEKTAEMIDSDGWLHSGDIGTILPNGALKLIDRRKNIFKLSIGEYIAPDKLQEIYKTVRGVSDIFVHGDSLKSVLVAIVYSDSQALTSLASELGIDGNYEELCQNPGIQKYFETELAIKAKESGLKGFERLAKIYLSPTSFEEAGLTTSTFKIVRHSAVKYFQSVIDNMYVGLE